MGDDDDGAGDMDAMVDVLMTLGVTVIDANRTAVAMIKRKASLMDIYGRGGIMNEASKRRNLNIEGLAALDLRTFKPDGKTPWDFNRKADRKEAEKLQRDLDPDWLVGAPPCTDW